MKDIVKMMRFDFIGTLSVSNGDSGIVLAAVVIGGLYAAISLFMSPICACTLLAGAGGLIVPLQSAKKDELGRLYGTLPVARKNITRARFLYIFLTHAAGTAVSLAFAAVCVLLDLNRFLPNTVESISKLSEYYDMDKFMELVPVFIGFAAFSCVTFAFMEMMGQIHGRENEMKILLILLGSVIVLVMGGVFILTQLGSPEIKLPEMPEWAGFTVAVIAVFGICMLFGEITAAKLAKREL